MKIKVADYIAQFFVKKGIQHIFTVTGGGAMHLNHAFGHEKMITCIYNHHEQACAMAAEAYTRLNNIIAPVCVTSGPGGTNALTGVLGGWLDSIPMFIISGQVKIETTIASTCVPLRQLGDQEFNIVDCVRAMTKYAYMVLNAEEIKYHLEKAWYFCQEARGGPVWLDIPLDIQAAIVETEDLIGFDALEIQEESIPVYNTDKTKEILELLTKARKPVIYAGAGVRLSGGYETFIQLIDKLNIPIVTTFNSHDLIWDKHSLFCGRPGTLGTRGGNFVVENSDLLLILGCRMNVRQVSYNFKDFAKESYKIMVDADKGELMKPTLSIDLPIHANVKDVMDSMVREIKEPINSKEHKKWLAWCRDINKKYYAVLPEYKEKNSPVNPYVFMEELFTLLDESEKIVSGNGSACVISFQSAEIKKGQRLFTNSGCASMGYAVPAAIGASFASNSGRVICLDGDGSLQMNIQELQTIVHHNLEVKLFVLNNNGYHSIRQTQTNLFQGNLAGVCKENGVSFPNIEKIAYAYDITYFKIEELNNMNKIIYDVLSCRGPVICEVMLDITQNFSPKLVSKVGSDGRMFSPKIDDMWPFLPREEYEENVYKED